MGEQHTVAQQTRAQQLGEEPLGWEARGVAPPSTAVPAVAPHFVKSMDAELEVRVRVGARVGARVLTCIGCEGGSTRGEGRGVRYRCAPPLLHSKTRGRPWLRGGQWGCWCMTSHDKLAALRPWTAPACVLQHR